MAYTTEAKIKTLFGTNKVNVWCSHNGNETAGDITTRLTQFITWGDAMIDARLTATPIANHIPFSTTPTVVEMIATIFAGVLAYEASGQSDTDAKDGRHRLSWLKQWAEDKLEMIASQKLAVV